MTNINMGIDFSLTTKIKLNEHLPEVILIKLYNICFEAAFTPCHIYFFTH